MIYGTGKDKYYSTRERRGVRSLTVCSQLSLFGEEWKDCEELKPQPRAKMTYMDKKREETKHRTEWCANASKYRCLRCGKGRKYMKLH